MSNMAYCRFQNTLQDLTDCYYHMDEPKSEEEIKARLNLITLCVLIADEFKREGS